MRISSSRTLWRNAVKAAAYELGLWPAIHRLRNAETLTVVMFHRVVAADDPAAAWADPGYAVSDTFLAEILCFFRRHFAIVGLSDVLAARRRQRPLPPNALLVTFDDGWADNLSTAQPVLAREGVPAVVFVATDAMGDPAIRWWQDELLFAVRSEACAVESLWRAAGESVPGDGLCDLLVRFSQLPEPARQAILAPMAPAVTKRQMLDPEGVVRLAASGIAIGSHGACHLPLTQLADPGSDLRRSRSTLGALLPGHDGCLSCVSLPHGRCNEAVIAAARDVGFELVFTSNPALNPAPGGWLESDVLGRIEVSAAEIGDAGGHAVPQRLAGWLFNRPYMM